MLNHMIQNRDTQKQRRLLRLELICLWEGRLNNARLRELLDVSQVRASELIREFRDEHSLWTRWDSKTRSFHTTTEAYISAGNTDNVAKNAESLSLYLALVGLPYTALATHGGHSERGTCAAFPDLSAPKPRIFAALSEAVRTRKSVEITYRSMREPIPHSRIISPHNLVRAGRRWHARAFCSKNNDFRDYALGRIVDVSLLGRPAEKLEIDDKAWMTGVPVKLIAHPGLSPEQESLIRFEYFNNTASRVETCRGSLVNYFIQDIRAAIDVKTQRPPEYQIAVANAQEVMPWLFPI